MLLADTIFLEVRALYTQGGSPAGLYFTTIPLIRFATSIHELLAATTSVTLTFITQKNGDKGEVVAHARSGDSLCCPVSASRATTVTSSMQVYAQSLYHTTGISPSAISARSLRAGGAMALLQGKCDSNVIKLLVRWHSDCMMRYLHQQSLPIFKNLASVVFNNGTYSFLPEEWVPAAAPSPPSIVCQLPPCGYGPMAEKA
eukprot:jgi/Psemu1/39837/gm1.39837_g